MGNPADFNEGKVTHFPSKVNSVYHLDQVLSKLILSYVEEHSWRKLAAAVNSFVRGQFKPAYRLVAEGKIEPEELEAEIKSYLPSRSYIEAYAKGTAICYRYTNTLANFFQQRYVFENFDPCDQYLFKLDDKIGESHTAASDTE